MKVQVTQRRDFSAHHMLLGAATAAFEDAKEKRPGWSYSQLTAITLSGLGIEAICNAIGERVIPDWKDFEPAPPGAKLRWICDQLGVPYDKTREPWGSIRWLLRTRNLIAHAKPQRVEVEHIWSRDEYDQLKPQPLSELEKELTLTNAERAVKAADHVLLLLTSAIKVEDRLGLYSDAWESSVRSIPEH